MKSICGVLILLGLMLGGCGGGQAAPEASLYALGSSAPTKISGFKGKVILIDCWATWCGPCRETMPNIQRIYDAYRAKGLEVLAVTTDAEPTVRSFLRSNPYSYRFYIDNDLSFSKAYEVATIPQTFVIDRGGNIVFRGHPAEDGLIEKAVIAALKE